jgi:hypothetical protein
MTPSSFHLETEARTTGLDHFCFEKHCLLCLEGGQKALRRPCLRLALLHVSVRLHRTSKADSLAHPSVQPFAPDLSQRASSAASVTGSGRVGGGGGGGRGAGRGEGSPPVTKPAPASR